MKLTRIAAPLLALTLLGGPGVVVAQGPPPPGYGRGPGPGGWDAPPRAYRGIQQQGFRDGIEGARKDIENHRRPNVNNRDEYRNPNVPRNVRRDYRNAFRQGYNTGMQHMLHGGPGRR